MNEATRHCTRCGAAIPEPARFCQICGASIDAAADDGSTTARLHGATPASRADDEPVPVWADESARETSPGQAPPPMDDGDRDRARDEDHDQGGGREGLRLDWDAETIGVVADAAEIEGMTVDELVRRLVVPAAVKIVRTKKGLVTLDEAADRLGVTRNEVVQMISAGRLRARKVDGDWKVEKASLDERKQTSSNRDEQIELDLNDLVQTSALMGLDTEGDASQSVSATLCYVNQAGVLVCPRSAWRRLGREKVVAEAKDAVRRYLRRRDREMGRI